MPDFRKLAAAAILADGVIDDSEVKVLTRELKEADGKIGEEGIKFLIELRDAAMKKAKAKKEEISQVFERFFFKVVTDNVLKDGKIDASEAAWLRSMLFADGKIDASEMDFLNTINKKAKTKSPEFEALYTECETKHKKAAKKPVG
jgi:uncharacterized membrane protein YebE (DUF533 family)